MGINDSYTSANAMPHKLLKHSQACVDSNFIYPAHVQLCPTNICNLDCSFCSCKNRDKSLSIPFSILKNAIDVLRKLGMRAVTITGGGEPCCYPDIKKLLLYLQANNIEIGLVSNGLLLHKIVDMVDVTAWCRVSVSDDRDVDKLLSGLQGLVGAVKTDWAFSYVVTAKFNIKKCIKIIEFANANSFTHVRLVSDLMDLPGLGNMGNVKSQLQHVGVNDSKVIYQDRQQYTKGSRECRISLLKPVLVPDGYVYPCCGVQYALKDNTGGFPESMRMCSIEDIKTYLRMQSIFDGRDCVKCYYQAYNDVLESLCQEYTHENFI